MANIITKEKTTLQSEEVILRAIHFFINEKWRVQTQSARAVTFIGGSSIKWLRLSIGIILLIIGFILFLIPFIGWLLGVPLIIGGAILTINGGGGFRTMGSVFGSRPGNENIAITVTSLEGTTEVTITNSKQADKLVRQFVEELPK
jgi:hypothetical protein